LVKSDHLPPEITITVVVKTSMLCGSLCWTRRGNWIILPAHKQIHMN